jgi:hypothetical protein
MSFSVHGVSAAAALLLGGGGEAVALLLKCDLHKRFGRRVDRVDILAVVMRLSSLAW